MGKKAKLGTGKSERRDPDWPRGLYQRPNGVFHYRRQAHGERRARSLETRKISYAIKRAMDYNEAIEDKRLPLQRALGKDTHTFQAAAQKYLQRHLKPRTIKRYKAILENFGRIAEQITGKPRLFLYEVDNGLLAEYINRRRSDPVSPNGHPNTPKKKGAEPKTIQEERNRICAVLRYAVTQNMLQSMPVISATVKTGSRQDRGASIARPLNNEELPRMFKAARQYDERLDGRFPYPTYFHDIIAFYVYVGLRHEELQFLEWSDVDLNSELISIRKKRIKCQRGLRFSVAAQHAVKKHLRGKKQSAVALPDRPDVLDDIGKLLRFKAHTALRKLRVCDFDFKHEMVTFQDRFEWSPKASEGDVPIHPKLKKILAALEGRNPSNFIFPDPEGRTVNGWIRADSE